ncbi:MAG: glycosyltransferase family 4 protein, partial [Nitrospira sp.]|nr:glycosyltransferase family 4 protein [Nitrospira sp.]
PIGAAPIPEIVDHGVTGFICDTIDEMVDAVGQVPLIDRKQCRAAFDERFTADRMARDYVALYERLLLEDGAVQATQSMPFGRSNNGSLKNESHKVFGRGRHV